MVLMKPICYHGDIHDNLNEEKITLFFRLSTNEKDFIQSER